MKSFRVVASVGCLLVACGEPGFQEGGEGAQRLEAGGVESDLAVPPSGALLFSVDANYPEATGEWQERVDAPLFQGAEARVTVTRDRFPFCGIEGVVKMGLLTESGQLYEVALEGGCPSCSYREGRFTVPSEGRELQVWFWAENDGWVEYDSSFGRNYRFPVHRWQPAVARFAADGAESLEGELQPGGALVVDYALDRLTQCRTSHHGFPSWTVLAHVSFGGAALKQPVVRFEYDDSGIPTGGYAQARAVFPVPYEATSVQVWFENVGYPGCQAWDSDFGRNYRFGR